MLSGGDVTVKQTAHSVDLDLTNVAPDEIATVVELTIEGDALAISPLKTRRESAIVDDSRLN